MKENSKCYELNDTFLYKIKNIYFNEYGYNLLTDMNTNKKYTVKSSTNCVKRPIKR